MTAYGGAYAAGIGGGYGFAHIGGNGGEITIGGGEVKAVGGAGGAGIGGGIYGSGGKITVTGGKVTALAGKKYVSGETLNGAGGAGIGGGNIGGGGTISITGGTVLAAGTSTKLRSQIDNPYAVKPYSFGAGIGGGQSGDFAHADGGTLTLGEELYVRAGDLYNSSVATQYDEDPENVQPADKPKWNVTDYKNSHNTLQYAFITTGHKVTVSATNGTYKDPNNEKMIYLKGDTVTLVPKPESGYQLNTAPNFNPAVALSNGLRFTMPDQDVTVSATFTAITDVDYKDAEGRNQTTNQWKNVYGITEWSDGWYVLNSSVTVYNQITVTGNVKLILSDNCTLSLLFTAVLRHDK